MDGRRENLTEDNIGRRAWVCRCAVAVLTVVLALLTGACTTQPAYPQLLVEADSLMISGEMGEVDSLLREYERQERRATEPERMYHKLLLAGFKYKMKEAEGSGLLLDSLVDYFRQHGTREKYAKALLYKGYAYYKVSDYHTAIKLYLQAYDEAAKVGDTNLMGWISAAEGNAYYYQAMFQEMAAPYRRYYYYASINRDARQMAIASQRMGMVFTAQDNQDSAVFYYQQAVRLAQTLKDSDLLAPLLSYRPGRHLHSGGRLRQGGCHHATRPTQCSQLGLLAPGAAPA